ncbi:MAG: hypothetical protein Q8K92_20130 [Leadbetterella sp.]|nr:hypothetical protein [Leadbetterella sp.]
MAINGMTENTEPTSFWDNLKTTSAQPIVDAYRLIAKSLSQDPAEREYAQDRVIQAVMPPLVLILTSFVLSPLIALAGYGVLATGAAVKQTIGNREHISKTSIANFVTPTNNTNPKQLAPKSNPVLFSNNPNNHTSDTLNVKTQPQPEPHPSNSSAEEKHPSRKM